MVPVPVALAAVLLAAAVAGAVLFVSRRLGRQSAVLAIASGFVAGYLVVVGVKRFPPPEKWHWLLPLAAAAALVGVVEQRATGLAKGLRAELVMVLAALAAWFMDLHPSAVRVVAIAGGASLVHLGLERTRERAGSRTFLAAVVVVAACTAAAIGLSGWATLGLVTGTLAAAAGVVAMASFRTDVLAGGVATFATALFVGVWLSAWVRDNLPSTSALLLAVSPFAAWMPVPDADAKPWRALVIRVGLVAVVAGAAVAVAVIESPPLDY